MNQRVIDQSQIEQSGRTMGQLLLDQGKLTPLQAESILRLQREQGLRFGEAALRLGFIEQGDIDRILATQFSYPYLPANDHSLDPKLLAAYQPFSPEVESIRSLRSQLLLRWMALEHKVVVVACPNEESSGRLLAANLAIVFSQLGERTLLIDANLRQSALGDLFGLKSGPGLSEVLSKRAGIEVIQKLNTLRDLSVLPAGAQPPNPQELLSRSDFDQLLTTLSAQYDVIIVDVPASSLAADVQVVAARAGGAIISVEMGVTSIDTVKRLRDSLQQAGAQVLGSVLHRSVRRKV
jgi:chain length determinant protein tyrosine kinase EpsG